MRAGAGAGGCGCGLARVRVEAGERGEVHLDAEAHMSVRCDLDCDVSSDHIGLTTFPLNIRKVSAKCSELPLLLGAGTV